MILNGIFQKIRGLFMNLLSITDVEQGAGINSCLTPYMKEAVLLWQSMYQGAAAWHTNGVIPCGVEKSIVEKIATPISEEIKVEVKNANIERVMGKLNQSSHTITDYLVSFGSCLMRPVYSNARVQFELVKLGNYVPISYDIDGTLTSCAVLTGIEDGKKKFTLVEVLRYENGISYVESKLYENQDTGGKTSLKEVPLTSCSKTENISPSFQWNGVKLPMFVEFRTRQTNRIDGSNVPTALISGAEDLIRQADEQWERINWEQEGGKMRVFADSDLFRKRQGDEQTVNPGITSKMNKLFVLLNGDNTEGGEKIKEHAPALRIEQQAKAMQEILKRIEQTVGLGRGTLSDLENVQQTATQYVGSKKSLYNKVDQFESEYEEKYKDCAYVFAYMESAYNGTPFNDEIEIKFNDMARKDPQSEKTEDLLEVQQGIMSKEEFRVKWYGEDIETAKAKVEEMKSNEPENIFGFNQFDRGTE